MRKSLLVVLGLILVVASNSFAESPSLATGVRITPDGANWASESNPVFITGSVTNVLEIKATAVQPNDLKITLDGETVDVTPATPVATDSLPVRVTNGTAFVDPTQIRALTSADVLTVDAITNSVNLNHITATTAIASKITDGTNFVGITNGALNVISGAESGSSYSGVFEQASVASGGNVTLGSVTVATNNFYPTYINVYAEGSGLFTFYNGTNVIGRFRVTNIMTSGTFPIGQGTSIPVGADFSVKFQNTAGAVQTNVGVSYFGKKK